MFRLVGPAQQIEGGIEEMLSGKGQAVKIAAKII